MLLWVIEVIKKKKWSWSGKDTNFQGGGRRFQGKKVTNSTVSLHVFSNSKCDVGKVRP